MKWLEILTEFNFMYWVAGCFALLEFFKWIWTFGEWLISQFGIETKNMRQQRENRERLIGAENDIKEIKETSEKNVETFLEHEKTMIEGCVAVKEEVIKEIGKLHGKIDEQREHLEEIDRENKQRSAAILRDRILGGLRYFSQNKDENDVVHISMTDFENMSHLFDEYEAAGGNGLIKRLRESQFNHFEIDADGFDTR